MCMTAALILVLCPVWFRLVSAVLDAEMENLFSKGRFSQQKPLLQVNYGSSSSLPAG